MNKTVNINVGGSAFTIDENAYETLKNYLNTIRSYFTEEEGRDEIMSDIESRIAEIFANNLSKSKNVISQIDVNEMIKILGNPEDFNPNFNKETGYSSEENNFKSTRGSKRVYRDNEDKIIGGVCSGISYYFDIDPLWIRLAFAGAFLAFGSGVLFYILLWVVIPEAKSTAEKLEMKGKKVDINNIGKQVAEEFEKVKSNFSKRSSEFNKNDGSKLKNSISQITDFFVSILEWLAKSFAKVFAFLFVAFGLFLLILLLSSIFGSYSLIHLTSSTENSFTLSEFLNLLFDGENKIILIATGLFLLFGIPLIMLVYKGLRILFKIKERNKIFSTVASVLFVTGLIICTYISIDTVNEFKKNYVASKTYALPMYKSYIIKSNPLDNPLFTASDDDNNDFNVAIDPVDGIKLGTVKFDIVKSYNDTTYLFINSSAKGKTTKIAFDRANKMNYNYSVSDSTISLNSFFTLGENQKWRNQKINIKLMLPVGKSVFLDPSMGEIIYDIKNVTNTLDEKMPGHTWTMTQNGLLCMECPED